MLVFEESWDFVWCLFHDYFVIIKSRILVDAFDCTESDKTSIFVGEDTGINDKIRQPFFICAKI